MAKEKNKAGRGRIILMLSIVLGPALLLVVFSIYKPTSKFETLPIYGQLPDYTYTDSKGIAHTSKELDGNILFVSTIQPSCPSDCGIDLWQYQIQIYKKLKNNQKKMSHVKIVSIVTDTNEVTTQDLIDVEAMLSDYLDKYAKEEGAGFDPNIWKIVKADPKDFYGIEHEGMNIYEETGDDYFRGNLYQELILLVDKKNNLRFARDGKREGYIREIYQHMALLQKEYALEAKKKKQDETAH